jgi:hypothetical protein
MEAQQCSPCDEHPENMRVAQAANPRSDVSREVHSLLEQHWRLEIEILHH